MNKFTKPFLILLTLSNFAFAVDEFDDIGDEFELVEGNTPEDLIQYGEMKAEEANDHRGLFIGQISLGDATFHAELYNRRDLSSKLLSSIGGRPSYYKLTAQGSTVNGVKKDGDVFRGRLQMEINKANKTIDFRFFKPSKIDGKISRDTSNDNLFWLVMVPFNALNLDSEINIEIALSAENLLPARAESRFYNLSSKEEGFMGNSIKINIVTKDASFFEEISALASRSWSNTKCAVGAAAGYLNNAFWGAYNYVGNNGVLASLNDAVETLAQVDNAVNAGNVLKDAAQNGTLLEGMKQVAGNKEQQKKVQESINNAAVLMNKGQKIASAINHQEIEINWAPMLLDAEKKVKDAKDNLARLQAQKAEYELEKDLMAEELAELEPQITRAELLVRIKTQECEIVSLQSALAKGGEGLADIEGKISAKSKMVEKLKQRLDS